MGTITRSFANNITTSGVLLPASLTNASIANVTAYNASVTTGGMVLVSSTTASSSASIEFTLGNYKEYQFYFINMHPQTDSVDFGFNFSTDSGSNYNVTKTTTHFLALHTEDDGSTTLAYQTGSDLAQSTADVLTGAGNLGADNDQSVVGKLSLFNPSSTTYVKHFIFDSTLSEFRDRVHNQYIAGYANTTSALTNIRFKMTSGNIDDGTILMYGIV
jgi:hypothetical protein